MKSYSQFVAESNEVSTTLVEEVYQGLLEDGYTEEEIGAAYHFYEHLVEEGVLTENPLAGLAKLGGRVLPGVGAGLYGADAVNRFRKGDWGGGLLQGSWCSNVINARCWWSCFIGTCSNQYGN